MKNFSSTLQFILDYFDEAVIMRQALKGKSMERQELLHILIDKTHLSWRGANTVIDDAVSAGLVEIDNKMYHLTQVFN